MKRDREPKAHTTLFSFPTFVVFLFLCDIAKESFFFVVAEFVNEKQEKKRLRGKKGRSCFLFCSILVRFWGKRRRDERKE